MHSLFLHENCRLNLVDLLDSGVRGALSLFVKRVFAAEEKLLMVKHDDKDELLKDCARNDSELHHRGL